MEGKGNKPFGFTKDIVFPFGEDFTLQPLYVVVFNECRIEKRFVLKSDFRFLNHLAIGTAERKGEDKKPQRRGANIVLQLHFSCKICCNSSMLILS